MRKWGQVLSDVKINQYPLSLPSLSPSSLPSPGIKRELVFFPRE